MGSERLYGKVTRRKENHLSLFGIVLLLCMILQPIHLQASDSVETLMAKGDSCRDLCFYKKAQAFYQQAYDHLSDADDPEHQMQLLERIMRTHFMMSHWKQMPEASYQLYHLAKHHHHSIYLSKALYMSGIRKYMQGEKEVGYKTCLEAMEIMKNTDYSKKNHELSVSYALLTNMYTTDKRFDDALRMLKEEERYAHQESVDGTCELCMRRVTVNRMHLLASMGRYSEADSLYHCYSNIDKLDPISGFALLSYYRLSGKTDEALRFIEIGRRHLIEDGDTIGRTMLRLLNDQGTIYRQLGEYQKAAECYADIGRISDSISNGTLRLMSEEVYKVIDNEHAIAQHRQMLIITIAGIVLLLTIILLLARHSFMEQRKNRSMMNTVQQLMRYRDQIVQNGDPVETDENNSSEVVAAERQRFKEVDKRIMKERLFAKPDFGRDDLMRLLGVDKNTLPSLIQRYSGTNVPGYVNNKRMEYAVSLIKQHPEYTLGAISEACGIKSSATFIRNFKLAYGMTPSDFRKQLEEDNLAPPNINI
jgi:AraC-like DNA-binding protein